MTAISALETRGSSCPGGEHPLFQGGAETEKAKGLSGHTHSSSHRAEEGAWTRACCAKAPEPGRGKRGEGALAEARKGGGMLRNGKGG